MRDSCRVHVVDNFTRGRRQNLRAAEATGRCTVHALDVTNPALNDLMVAVRPEVVFHLAAQIDIRTSVQDPASDATINVLGTINVAESALRAGTRKVVFASSGGAIYGVPEFLPASETTPVRPLSPYGVSKIAGEMYLNTYSQLHDLDCCHLALANAYGPRQDPRNEGGVVAVFAQALVAGEPTVLFGDGQNTRDYVFVEDIVDAMVRAAEHGEPGCRYNIGTAVEVTDRQLHTLVADAAEAPDSPGFAPARAGDVRASALDATAARRTLGWRPRVSLSEGVQLTVDYHASQLAIPA